MVEPLAPIIKQDLANIYRCLFFLSNSGVTLNACCFKSPFTSEGNLCSSYNHGSAAFIDKQIHSTHLRIDRFVAYKKGKIHK